MVNKIIVIITGTNDDRTILMHYPEMDKKNFVRQCLEYFDIQDKIMI